MWEFKKWASLNRKYCWNFGVEQLGFPQMSRQSRPHNIPSFHKGCRKRGTYITWGIVHPCIKTWKLRSLYDNFDYLQYYRNLVVTPNRRQKCEGINFVKISKQGWLIYLRANISAVYKTNHRVMFLRLIRSRFLFLGLQNNIIFGRMRSGFGVLESRNIFHLERIRKPTKT